MANYSKRRVIYVYRKGFFDDDDAYKPYAEFEFYGLSETRLDKRAREIQLLLNKDGLHCYQCLLHCTKTRDLDMLLPF